MTDRTAWECPRCHKVNAPHVDQCECKPADGMTYPEVIEKYFPKVPIVVEPRWPNWPNPYIGDVPPGGWWDRSTTGTTITATDTNNWKIYNQ